MTERPKLAVLCKMLRNTVDPQKHTTGKVWHYSIPAFDRDRKPFLTVGHEILSSKLLLTEPCILFSRLNPRIPRVWYFSGPPSDLPCVASTEFVPFTVTKPDRLDARYLYWFLHSPEFVRTAQNAVQAATKSRERANKDRLLEARIPLPPLAEQKRIAAVLAKADRVRRLRRYALEVGAGYLQSVFLEMFGDPATNPMGWDTKPLRSLASKFSDGPFGSNLKSEHYVDTGVRVIRLQNIGTGEFLDEDKAFVSPQHFQRLSKHRCVSGDLMVATLGDPNLRACLMPPYVPIALNKADCIQVRVDTRRAIPQYVCWLLNLPETLQIAASMIHGQTRSRINSGQLAQLELPVPPLELQLRFSGIVGEFEGLRRKQIEALRQADHLMKTLLDRCFSVA